MQAGSANDPDVLAINDGLNLHLTIEVKLRSKLPAYITSFLERSHILAMREDRGEWLITMRAEDFFSLINCTIPPYWRLR